MICSRACVFGGLRPLLCLCALHCLRLLLLLLPLRVDLAVVSRGAMRTLNLWALQGHGGVALTRPLYLMCMLRTGRFQKIQRRVARQTCTTVYATWCRLRIGTMSICGFEFMGCTASTRRERAWCNGGAGVYDPTT